MDLSPGDFFAPIEWKGKLWYNNQKGGMKVGNVIIGCILSLLAIGAFAVSVCSFREKGFLFNNAYIYATKQQRESMDKRPYYHQSAIAFLMVGAALLLIGLSVLLDAVWLTFAGMAAALAAVIYAVASEMAIGKQGR